MTNPQSGIPVVIAPSGDTSGATDTANINGALNSQGPSATIQLEAGLFYIDQPIVIPPFETLQGAPSSGLIGTTGCGTVIQPVAAFSAGKWPVAAAILVVDQATGGYPTVSQEQHLFNVMIHGSLLSATSIVHGIGVYGGAAQIGRLTFQNVLVHAMTGWGFLVPRPAGQVRAFNVGVRSCGTNPASAAGGFLVHCSDSEWLYCSSYSNHGDAWQILNSFDSLFQQCHAEHSQDGYGFSYLATYNNANPDAGGITFEGCTVDAGARHGFFIASSGPARPPVNVVGGFVRRCGTSPAPADLAGYCVSGYSGPVNFVGCQTYPGLRDGGGGTSTPPYGMAFLNNDPQTAVTVTGGVFIGASGGIFSDGTAGLVTVSASTSFGQGQGTGTVVYTPGVALQQARSGAFLPVDPILAVQPAGCLATSHDRQQVTGSFSPVSGTAYYRLVRLVAGLPVSRINMWVTGTAKTGGTHGFANIVSVATGAVVASSADQADASATWGKVNSLASIPLSAPYTPTVTGAYWLGFMVAVAPSGTMPTLGSPAAGADRNIVAVPPVSCGSAGRGLTGPLPIGATVSPRGVRGDDFYVFAT